MRLFVGLGNPGGRYARHRHNVGFMAVDRIAEDHRFAPWRSRFQGLVSEGMLGDSKVVLLKPQSFMNLSGQSVGEAMRFWKLAPSEVTVFHDELDLAPGKVRVKTGGGHAGHNGLRSLHEHIGDAYHRVRIGIGHPGHKDRVAGYVLSDFAKAESDGLEDLLSGISEGARALALGETGKFLNAVSLRTAPPRSGTGQAPERGGPDRNGPDRNSAAAGGSGAAAKDRAGAPKSAAARPEPAPEPKAGPEPEQKDTRSALQRLADRFR